MTPASSELRDLAASVALEAGALLRARQGEVRTSVATKSTATDMVSEVDHESEALIVARLLAARPGDAILGEEGGARAGTSGVRWVVDPLDGTTNYLYGRGDYSVSIGVEVDGQGVAGVVYDPTRDELFAAARGSGATRNGRPIGVSDKAVLATALIGTGFAYNQAWRAAQGALAARMLPHVRDIRRAGSAALDLCAVACGRLDGYYEPLGHWDMAAGIVIVEEAGGLTAFEPIGDGMPEAVVAAGPALFERLLALLREHRA